MRQLMTPPEPNEINDLNDRFECGKAIAVALAGGLALL